MNVYNVFQIDDTVLEIFWIEVDSAMHLFSYEMYYPPKSDKQLGFENHFIDGLQNL